MRCARSPKNRCRQSHQELRRHRKGKWCQDGPAAAPFGAVKGKEDRLGGTGNAKEHGGREKQDGAEQGREAAPELALVVLDLGARRIEDRLQQRKDGEQRRADQIVGGGVKTGRRDAQRYAGYGAVDACHCPIDQVGREDRQAKAKQAGRSRLPEQRPDRVPATRVLE